MVVILPLTGYGMVHIHAGVDRVEQPVIIFLGWILPIFLRHYRGIRKIRLPVQLAAVVIHSFRTYISQTVTARIINLWIMIIIVVRRV